MEEIKESNHVFFTREVASNIIGGSLVITDKKTGIRIAFQDFHLIVSYSIRMS